MRNNSVDFLKCLLAYEVVMLHCNQAPIFLTRPIVDSAVPCFFMISGYFTFDQNVEKYKTHTKKAIIKILWIFLWSTLICSVNDIYGLLVGQGINATKVSLWDFFIFNENPFAFHLWYISAYLYVLLVCFVLRRFVISHVESLSISLWFSGVIFAFLYSCFQDEGINIIYIRNFLFQGLPFFIAGHMIKKRICYIYKIHSYYVILFLLFSIFISIYFKMYIDKYNVSTYFFSGIIAFLFLILFVKLKMNDNLFSLIGKEDSLYVYIFHPLVMKVFSSEYIVKNWGQNPYFYPTCVFFTTVVGIRIIRYMYLRCKNS